MGNERLPKLVVFGEVGGGRVTWEGNNGTVWIVSTLSLFNLPTEEEHCALEAKKSGKWF